MVLRVAYHLLLPWLLITIKTWLGFAQYFGKVNDLGSNKPSLKVKLYYQLTNGNSDPDVPHVHHNPLQTWTLFTLYNVTAPQPLLLYVDIRCRLAIK